MLNIEELLQLAEMRELQKKGSSPTYIWIAGPAAAGKTFVIEHLAIILQRKGKVSIISDGAILLKVVSEDIAEVYHTGQGESLLVTDVAIDDRIHQALIEEIEKYQGDFLLIELARGKDMEGYIDLSYERILRRLTNKILNNSVFVYLACPYEERVKRNKVRHGETLDGNYRRINPIAVTRFFQGDDFEQWKDKIGSPFIILNNS